MESNDNLNSATDALGKYANKLEKLRENSKGGIHSEIGPLVRYRRDIPWFVRQLELSHKLANEADGHALAVLDEIAEKAFANFFLDMLYFHDSPMKPEDKLPYGFYFEKAYALGIWGLLESVGRQSFDYDTYFNRHSKLYSEKSSETFDRERESRRQRMADAIKLRKYDKLDEYTVLQQTTAEKGVNALAKLFHKMLSGREPCSKDYNPYLLQDKIFVNEFLRRYSMWACDEHVEKARGKLFGLLKNRLKQEAPSAVIKDLDDMAIRLARDDNQKCSYGCGRQAKAVYPLAAPASDLLAKVLDMNLNEDMKNMVAQIMHYEDAGQPGPFEIFHYRTITRLNPFVQPAAAAFMAESVYPQLHSLWRDAFYEATLLIEVWIGAVLNAMSEI